MAGRLRAVVASPGNRVSRPDPALWLVVAFSLLAAAPLAGPDYFFDAHDAPNTVFFLTEFDAALRDGVWYPGWATDQALGYGYPTFVLYPPLAYYAAEGFHLLGATKVALGHHRDDMLQTFFLNMFFGGKLKSMPPKLVSDDGRHVVIRPLAFVAEKDTTQWAKVRQFPIIPCNLCGSQENLQRKQVGEMLREWQKKYPGRVENMFNALQNVVPSHLLDGALYDFKGARATGVADDNGDKAFDAEDFPEPSALPGVQVVRIQ